MTLEQNISDPIMARTTISTIMREIRWEAL
jgi:hypothetical protein